ncbi:TetR/AcrR family transcriptional regulator [Erysipelothrix piscisicarius]|uniref:TetR/AcrR family transcriptional regulator n=2 Tax=Erysipelothrix TaxID=1647 RepID=UPI002F926EF0
MKKAVISKESLLEVAKDIVFKDGLDQLNMRNLAQKAEVSIGSVYNYFPSKNKLILDVIEDFWKQVFYDDICNVDTNISFVNFIEQIYERIRHHMDEFNSLFMSHVEIMNQEAKMKGHHVGMQYVDHIRAGLLVVLKQDPTIKPTAFTDSFTQDGLLDFVFLHIFISLR